MYLDSIFGFSPNGSDCDVRGTLTDPAACKFASQKLANKTYAGETESENLPAGCHHISGTNEIKFNKIIHTPLTKEIPMTTKGVCLYGKKHYLSLNATELYISI